MKKIISMLLLIAMLFSVTGGLSLYAEAAEVSVDEYVDFEGYAGHTRAGKYSPVTDSGHLDYIAAGTDPEGIRGTNAEITGRTDVAGPFANWESSGDESNVIWGLSVYPEQHTTLYISPQMRKANSNAVMGGLLRFDNGRILFNESELERYTEHRWYDLRLAFNFKAHYVKLYIDGIERGTANLDPDIIAMRYLNVNYLMATAAATTLMDDFVEYTTADKTVKVYAESNGNTTDIKSVPVQADTKYIEIDAGAELKIEETDSIEAYICTKDGTVVPSHIEYTGRKDYMTDFPSKVRIYPDAKLDPSVEYSVVLSGAKNLFDENVAVNTSFKTASSDSSLFIEYKSTILNGNADATALPADTKVNFNIIKTNVSASDSIEIIRNGEVIDTISAADSEFSLKLADGINEIVVRSAETGTKSEPVIFTGISYATQKTMDSDFNGSDPKGAFSSAEAGGGSITPLQYDDEHGISLKVVSETGDGAFFIPPVPGSAKGIVSLEYEALFETRFNFVLCAAVCQANGSRVDHRPLTLNANGDIVTESNRVLAHLELNEWYKIKMFYNIQDKTYSFFLNDEAVMYEEPLSPQRLDGIDRIVMNINHPAEGAAIVWFDNFKEYALSENYTVSASYYNKAGEAVSSNKVSYDGATIDLEFSQSMDSSSLNSGVKLMYEDGEAVSYTGSYNSATSVYSMRVDKLEPNMSYKIEISATLLSEAGGRNGGESVFKFKTSKDGFHLESYELIGGDTLADIAGKSSAEAEVKYNNDTDTAQEGVIFFGIYKDNMLYSYATNKINTQPGIGYASLSAKMPSDAAKGEYHTEIYLLDSLEKLNLIDLLDGDETTAEEIVKKNTFAYEAEDMILSSDMTVINDSAASGGKAIRVTASSAATTIDKLPEERSFYIEDFAEVPGTYAIWVRVKTPNDGADSVWYSFNSNIYQMWSFSEHSNNYYWVNMGYVNLQQGKFHISFKYRELNFVADRLIITNKLGFEPVGKDDMPAEGDEALVNPYNEAEIKPIPEHPRLFLTSGYIPHLKSNLQSDELKPLYDTMLKSVDKDLSADIAKYAGTSNEDLEEAIEMRAFMYVLGERDDAYGRKTIDYTKEYLSNVQYSSGQDITRKVGNAMLLGAMVYDWCYDLMTKEDKEFFIRREKELATMKEIGYPPTKMASIGEHAGEFEIMRDMISAGIAMYDEDPEMYNLAAGRFFDEYVESRRLFNKSGNHPQGSAYGSFRYECELWATMIFDRMGYPNILGEEQADVAYKWIYERLPFGAWFKDGDDPVYSTYSYFNYSGYDTRSLILAANLFKDPYVRRSYMKTINQSRRNNNYIYKIWHLLFAEPEAEIKEVNDLPLTRRTTYPLSSMVARTSWQSGIDAPTAMAHMKIQEKNIGDHMHLDSGTFQLYYKGSLATSSGVYEGQDGGSGSSHQLNYYKRTIAHNAVTVYNPIENVYPQLAGASNDGGQKQPANGGQKTYEEMMSTPDVAATVGSYIGPNEYTPKFSYIKGDITNAYSSKISSYNRSMVFMDLFDEDYPAAFVVFDKVNASFSLLYNYTKTWLMHSIEEPEVSGNTTVIKRTESYNAYQFNGKLVNKTLLPESVNINKVNGYYVNGKEYPNRDKVNSAGKAYDTESAKWRIEVSPKTNSRETTFLNSMYMTDADRDLPELAMTKVTGGGMTGVEIKDRLVMFSDTAKNMTGTITLTIPDNGNEIMSCLLTDMSAGTWRVRADGKEDIFAQSKDGEYCIYFEAAPGTYTITMADGALTSFDASRVAKPEIGDFQIYYYGVYLNQKHPVKEIDNRPYVSVDDAAVWFKKLPGLSVSWNNDHTQATLKRGSYTIVASDGQCTVNGQSGTIAAKPVMIDGILYIPIDDLKTPLGLTSSRYDLVTKVLYL